jgi:PilZ domain-containing protein
MPILDPNSVETMTLQPDTLPATDTDEPARGARIPQPHRPNLPIRVPVAADFGGGTVLLAEVIGSTDNVLLLQGPDSGATLAPLGTPVRLRVGWDRQMLTGRLAAHGVEGRFLISIGERAIRRSRRFPVDLPGVARSPLLPGPVEVRVTDLSTGGARVEGVELAVGSEVELRFTPPGRPTPITVLGFVVRLIEIDGARSVGLAFRLVQPSTDLLGNAEQSAT